MGARASKPSAEEEVRIARKCAARRTAYQGCLAANKGEPRACERLETALAMCFAAELPGCAAASEDHQRCFMSVVNTGRYKGRLGCGPELDALKAGLKRHGLYPFAATAK
ncbi:MAG: hypothetical protein J3K34DRAFT_518417 [Monoraphidium minutum]|nr:MAG: hypothetical protein J3K34DRAFT_518417 [Monoraphidium minutum]